MTTRCNPNDTAKRLANPLLSADTCRPITEDLRGAWRYRLGCSESSCDWRPQPTGRVAYLSALLKSAGRAAGFIDMRAGGNLRCTREGASTSSCVILDSARVSVEADRLSDGSLSHR